MLAFLLLCPLLRSLRSLLIFRISFTNKLHAIHNVQRFRLCVREREGKRLSTLDRWLLPFVRCSCSWFSYSMSNVLMFIVDFNSKCLCTIYAIHIHIAIESRLFTLSLSLSRSVSRFRVIFSLSSVIYGCTTNISLHSLHVVLIIPLCIVGYRLAVAAVAAFRLTLLWNMNCMHKWKASYTRIKKVRYANDFIKRRSSEQMSWIDSTNG